MKKTLLSAFALFLALGMSAQQLKALHFDGQLNKVAASVAKSNALKAPAKASLNDNQRAVGNYNDDSCDGYLSTYKGDNKAAIILEPSEYAPFYGAKVVGVRFNLGQGCSSSGVFVNTMSSDGYLHEFVSKDEDVTSAAGATNTGEWHTVLFDEKEQFTLSASTGTLMVGYNFTDTGKNYAVGTSSSHTGVIYLYANVSTAQGGQGLGWYNLGTNYGALCAQLIVESDNFKTNAVTPSDFGDFRVALGQTKTVNVGIFNMGTSLTSLDYTYSVDGKTSEEKHLDFGKDLGKGFTGYLPIEFEAAEKTGQFAENFTITKVNGVKNEAQTASATGTNYTLAKAFKRGVLVEQFTGTGCGWCPRGHVAMHNMAELYGDQFVGVALHQYNSSDPMYFNGYNLGFSGAPSSMVNRSGSTGDPYYNAQPEVAEVVDVLPLVGIKLSGSLNEARTSVEAKASVEPLVSANDYTIAYVLTGDGLTGSTNAWKQTNYYSSAYGKFNGKSSLPSDLQFLWDEPGSFSTTFDDVALASSYVGSRNKATLGELVEGQTTESSYTFNIPTKASLKTAIDKNKLYVVAMVLDADGHCVNAAKAYVQDGTTGIADVTEGSNGATVVARYSVDGVKLSVPQKGVNIVKMSDGTTRKVVIK